MASSYRIGPPSPHREKLKTLPTLSSLKQTAFISKADRFVYHYQDNPGPGAYDSPIREKHSGDYHVERKEQSIVPKQHQWIISKGRQPFEVRQPFQTHTEPAEESITKKSHSDWSKNMRFNYQKLEKKSNVGPGKYNPESSIKKRSQTLTLKERASPRAYIDTLMKQTREHHKQCSDLQEQLLQMKIDAIEISKETPKAVKNAPSSVFKSNSKRLYSERILNYVGPGTYDIQATPKHNKKPQLLKSHLRLHDRTKSSSLLQDQSGKECATSPGPGAYQISNLLDRQHKKAALGLILREERFSSRQNPGPGPGEYMRKRFVYINQNQNHKLHLFAHEQQRQPTFGTTERFQPSNQSPHPFGQYDLSYNDISQKLARHRENKNRSKHSSNHPPLPVSPS